MGRGASRTYFIRHLFRMLLRERETVAFPAGEPEISEHYQGQIVIDIEHCRGCGLCVQACPADALHHTALPDKGLSMVVYHDRCACCGLCEIVCTSQAIRREPVFHPGAVDKETLRQEWRREGPRKPVTR